ncbi:hypothetical protein CHARACLAT_011764 [Characodon lateralis]|uniref:Spermatogenesis-associated protein 6 N-terminal domain-containing protein n=1 Tax=Characodon lateralis TaxID=208331 RepID=A0ABU7EU04_9TELE|nr:hypothetical protein [Characodon lateralis]
MSRKALKVLAEIKIRAVSCPGVHLSAKDDIYLRMDFMGQFHQSECLPAVFPLLFHEKMTFEKIFRHAVDPGDIAVLLKYEAVRIELVQLIPPAGDTLACFEEDARSFLFPEPKLVPPFSGVGREVLMRTAPHFPGIAPRLEFSTRTTITECPPDTEVTICPKTPIRPAIRRKMRRSSIPRSTPPQTAWGRESVRMDRERPRTVKPLLYIPRSQSMSPGRENLAQLSIDSAPPLTPDWETRSQPMPSSWPAAGGSASPKRSALYFTSLSLPVTRSSSTVSHSSAARRRLLSSGLSLPPHQIPTVSVHVLSAHVHACTLLMLLVFSRWSHALFPCRKVGWLVSPSSYQWARDRVHTE